MHVNVKNDFSHNYDTFIIAYCPDTDEFFTTNQRSYFWESFEFNSEYDAALHVANHVSRYIQLRNEIAKSFGQPESNTIFLSTHCMGDIPNGELIEIDHYRPFKLYKFKEEVRND